MVISKKENAYFQFLKLEPLIHIVIWVMVLFYPYVKYFGKEGGYNMPFTHELLALFFKMTISYFLYFWFFPKNNKKKNVVILLLFFLINLAVYEWLDGFYHNQFLESCCRHYWKHFFANSLTHTSFGIVFFSIYSMKKLYKKQYELDTLNKEKRRSELQALKAQVNPHFLFNTLNTIYSSALKKEDKTAEMILKLSGNFRYLLHEGQKEEVPIKKEIRHIKDYVSLQEERLSSKVKVDFNVTIDNVEQNIAPLLLISFIENAFKYTSLLKGSNHNIIIRIELKDGVFGFCCINPYNRTIEEDIDNEWKESGIGISNTKKRLQHLYPNKHELQIDDKEDVFKVTLKIIL
ncbi:sensor histidine kinase [Aquimarina sediminis]|uniref:sensor histidine kinase n=1 Tax=Aquimarina sediminis TaxID=2070536 RepID=UPI000CA07543|nr:histidine kinase [Aquimarina sediminis]